MSANCTKCGEPRDTTGYPLWCKACRAKHKKESDEIRRDLLKSQAFRDGSEAMQEYLAAQFERYGPGLFSGTEIAALIQQAPGPLVGQD